MCVASCTEVQSIRLVRERRPDSRTRVSRIHQNHGMQMWYRTGVSMYKLAVPPTCTGQLEFWIRGLRVQWTRGRVSVRSVVPHWKTIASMQDTIALPNKSPLVSSIPQHCGSNGVFNTRTGTGTNASAQNIFPQMSVWHAARPYRYPVAYAISRSPAIWSATKPYNTYSY